MRTDRPGRADGSERVRDARARYFDENGLSEEGYRSRWVVLRAGPVPIYMPNTSARRRAVPLHDLHHIATGYDTTWSGEAEIAAWELAAGCGRYWAAWGLNLGAASLGLLIAPRRTLQAFRRGRRGRRSLYRDPAGFTESLLDLSVADLRRTLALD